jgi:glutamine synthetase adenylyltransferase
MIQYWVLQSAQVYPVLTDYTDNLSLLRVLADNGIIDAAKAEVLSEAYRHYLRLEYRAKLMDQEPLVDLGQSETRPEQIREVWAGIFGAAGKP